MSRWGLTTLENPWATVPLFLTGLGVGLAMAPVNAALLSATHDSTHGVSSALLVVSRTVGKLVGISALTTTHNPAMAAAAATGRIHRRHAGTFGSAARRTAAAMSTPVLKRSSGFLDNAFMHPSSNGGEIPAL